MKSERISPFWVNGYQPFSALSKLDIAVIEDMKSEINQVVSSDECPPLQKKGICKNCSYYEFCYSREEEE